VEYSLATFNLTPEDYAESVGWLGQDVWHAHCVQLRDRALEKFGHTGTGVAHCPCSNMRLGSGIAPIRKMLDHAVPVGLGVDGAASNDASNLLHEARTAFLLARVRDEDPGAITAREVLEIATRGGARVLGRDDIGYLVPGMAADFVAINIDQPQYVGTSSDPVAALIFCQTDAVDYSFINGKKVIDRGRILNLDLDKVHRECQQLAIEMMS
jgi:cytosine/adenosine deaminase-related metal-dependent hydrolase